MLHRVTSTKRALVSTVTHIIVSDSEFDRLDALCNSHNSDGDNGERFENFAIAWKKQTADGYKCLYHLLSSMTSGCDRERSLMENGDEGDGDTSVCDEWKVYSINVNLYRFSQFHNRLQANWLQALMCVYLPMESFVWQSDFEQLDPSRVRVMYRKLAFSVIAEAGKHFQMARRKWGVCHNNCNSSSRSSSGCAEDSVEDIDRDTPNYLEKKYIVHALRDVLLGIQIARNERIDDYSCANQYFYEIVSCERTDWDHYQRTYYPLYQRLKDEFNSLVDKPCVIGGEDASDDTDHKRTSPHPNYTLVYLNNVSKLNRRHSHPHDLSDEEYALDVLNRHFSINCTPVNNMTRAYHLAAQVGESSKMCIIAIECCGLVVQWNGTEWFLRCAVPPAICEYNYHYAPKIDYSTVRVKARKSCGVFEVILFYNDSPDSPSASGWTVSTRESCHALPSCCNVNTGEVKSLDKSMLPTTLPITDDDRDKTFIFHIESNEFLDSNNQSLLLAEMIKYNCNRIYLTSVVDNRTAKFLNPEPFVLKYNNFASTWKTINLNDSSVFHRVTHIDFHSVDEVQTFSLSVNPILVHDLIIEDEALCRISVPCTQSHHLHSLVLSLSRNIIHNDSSMVITKSLVDVIRSVAPRQEHLEQVTNFITSITCSDSDSTLTNVLDAALVKYRALCTVLQSWSDEWPDAEQQQKPMVNHIMKTLDISLSFPATVHDRKLDTGIRDAIVAVLMAIRCGKKCTPSTSSSPTGFMPRNVCESLAMSHERIVWKLYEQFTTIS